MADFGKLTLVAGLVVIAASIACGKSSVPKDLPGTYWRQQDDRLSFLKVRTEGIRYADASGTRTDPMLFDTLTCSSAHVCRFTTGRCSGTITIGTVLQIETTTACPSLSGVWKSGPAPRAANLGCNDANPEWCF